MQTSLFFLLACFMLFPALSFAEIIPGKYIVTFRDGTTDSEQEVTRLLGSREARVHHIFQSA